MNAPNLLRRLAELSDERHIAELLAGTRVRVGTAWLTVASKPGTGEIVLLNSDGEDVEYSDLEIIEAVVWPHRGAGPTHSVAVELVRAAQVPVGVSAEALAAVTRKEER